MKQLARLNGIVNNVSIRFRCLAHDHELQYRFMIAIILTSDQVGLRAELKHINKRRKRNQQGFP